MATTFTIPTIFTAKDNFSNKVARMTKELDKFNYRIDYWGGGGGSGGGGKKINDFYFMDDKTIASWNRLGDTAGRVALQAGVAGLAILYPLKKAVETATEFENKIADIGKIQNFAIGEDGFNKAAQGARRVGVELAIGATKSAEMMAELAPIYRNVNELEDVALAAGKIGVAFGLSALETGSYFANVQKSLQITTAETKDFMGMLNEMDNKYGARAKNLLTFFNAGAGVASAAIKGGNIGDNSRLVASMGSLLIERGYAAPQASTVIERMVKRINEREQLRSVFNKSGRGAEGILGVLRHGASLPEGESIAYFKKFGEFSSDVTILAKSIAGLEERYALARSELAKFNSVNDEFAKRTETAQFALDQLNSYWEDFQIGVGNVMLPIIRDAAMELKPMIESFGKWAEENPKIVKWIVIGAASLGLFLLAVSAVAAVVAAFAKTMAATGIIINAFRAGMWALSVATWAATAPFWVLVGAASIIYLLISNFKEWGAAVTLVAGITLGFFAPFLAIAMLVLLVIQSFREHWDAIAEAFSNGDILTGIKLIGATLLDALLYPLEQAFELIGKFTNSDWAKKIGADIHQLRIDMFAAAEEGKSEKTPVGNPRQAQNDSLSQTINKSQETVTVDFKNVPQGVQINGKEFNTPNIKPGIASTLQYSW